jgi:hypothetical protein
MFLYNSGFSAQQATCNSVGLLSIPAQYFDQIYSPAFDSANINPMIAMASCSFP